jgi:anti-sigma B factor antagonist
MRDQSSLPIDPPAVPPPTFSITIKPRCDAVQLAPKGELDLATVEQLQRELDEVIDAGLPRIVIDLRGVEFLDSTALHALIAAHTRAQQDGWTLEIIPATPAVQRLFELTSTLERLPFTDDNGRMTSHAPPPEITSTGGAQRQQSPP